MLVFVSCMVSGGKFVLLAASSLSIFWFQFLLFSSSFFLLSSFFLFLSLFSFPFLHQLSLFSFFPFPLFFFFPCSFSLVPFPSLFPDALFLFVPYCFLCLLLLNTSSYFSSWTLPLSSLETMLPRLRYPLRSKVWTFVELHQIRLMYGTYLDATRVSRMKSFGLEIRFFY